MKLFDYEMENINALLKMFGERYIFCDNEQAVYDAQMNRDDMIEAYAAILHYAEIIKNQES